MPFWCFFEKKTKNVFEANLQDSVHFHVSFLEKSYF